MNRNILMISHYSGGGGAEVVFFKTVEILSQNNFNVYIIIPQKTGWLYEKLKENSCIKGIYVSKNKLMYEHYNFRKSLQRIFFNNLKYAFKLRKLVIEKNIDVIYGSTIINVLPVILSLITHKKVIWHIHEVYSKNFDIINRKVDKIFKFFFLNSEIIFISKDMKLKWIKRLNIDERILKSCLIYNPIKEKIKKIEKYSKENIVFGFVGSATKNKNIDLLLSSIEILQNNYKKIELRLYGSGIPNYINNSLKEQKLKIENLKYFEYKKVEDIYSEIDFLVLPSFNESWGLVVLEAMQYGVIPIVTQETGLKELFRNKENIFYFNPYIKEEFIKTLEEVMKLKENELKNIKENNIKLLEKYKFNENYERGILNVFRNIKKK